MDRLRARAVSLALSPVRYGRRTMATAETVRTNAAAQRRREERFPVAQFLQVPRPCRASRYPKIGPSMPTFRRASRPIATNTTKSRCAESGTLRKLASSAGRQEHQQDRLAADTGSAGKCGASSVTPLT